MRSRCDDVEPQRPLYDWRPNHCSLRPFEAAGVCALLRGRQVCADSDDSDDLSLNNPKTLDPTP